MHVFLIAATSGDGFIGPLQHQVSTAWTSQEDKQWFQKKTKEAGVVVMGSTTYGTVGKPLPGRLNIVYSSAEAESEIPVRSSEPSTHLVYTKQNPAALLHLLEEKRYTEVAICGGSSIYTMFMKAGLIDTLYLTVEAKFFGKGVPLFNEEVSQNVQLKDVEKLGEHTVLLTYSVMK